jgi:hypothetical protein
MSPFMTRPSGQEHDEGSHAADGSHEWYEDSAQIGHFHAVMEIFRAGFPEHFHLGVFPAIGLTTTAAETFSSTWLDRLASSSCARFEWL